MEYMVGRRCTKFVQMNQISSGREKRNVRSVLCKQQTPLEVCPPPISKSLRVKETISRKSVISVMFSHFLITFGYFILHILYLYGIIV